MESYSVEQYGQHEWHVKKHIDQNRPNRTAFWCRCDRQDDARLTALALNHFSYCKQPPAEKELLQKFHAWVEEFTDLQRERFAEFIESIKTETLH